MLGKLHFWEKLMLLDWTLMKLWDLMIDGRSIPRGHIKTTSGPRPQ
jgi:hypothetical protein